MALPFPPAIAFVVITVLGKACNWLVFLAAEMLGILIGIAVTCLVGLDPIRYSKTFLLQQPWQKAYLWPDPLGLRQGVASVTTVFLVSLSAFFFPAGEFVTAIFSGVLGAWAYEGVRIYQNVYVARPVAQPGVPADPP